MSKRKLSNNSIGIGIMSGTSLDGLDLALCHFSDTYKFDLLQFKSISYTVNWKSRLASAHKLDGLNLRKLEIEYSEYVAIEVVKFLEKSNKKVDFLACHGHTIFHQPDKRLTLQIIDGSILSILTGIKTVCDFRSGDMALGGQGAPLVPIGDRLLFGQYAACLNLGGFANLSFEKEGKRIAYDISPANLLLNALANREGMAYDKGGMLARKGILNTELLQKLDDLAYYKTKPPKSLGREWLEENILPLLANHSTTDLLATAAEHIANQIGASLNTSAKKGEVLVTGGGAHNSFLMERIAKNTHLTISMPSTQIIDAKEAIVFALLGKLRLDDEINTLASVTGASRDSCAGSVYQ